MSSINDALAAALARAATAARERAGVAHVPRVDARALSALDFARRFIAPSRPCVLVHGVDAWPALARWRSRALLLADAGAAANVTVSETPDGRADAAARGVMRLPADRALPLAAALDVLRDAPCGVPYVSAQNDSLRRETPRLVAAACGGAVRAATEALGGEPVAINLWACGPSAPTSAVHRDHYDNLHTVVTGAKRFTLFPPQDALFLDKRPAVAARWRHDAAACARARGGACAATPPCWSLVAEPGAQPAPCAHVDVGAPSARDATALAAASPLVVELAAGETLFLPRGWYHYVQNISHQAAADDDDHGLCICVNAWFESEMGGNEATAEVFEELAAALAEHSAVE